MDPLERAKLALSRASQACAAASHILPARASLQATVSAAASDVAALRAAAQSQALDHAAAAARLDAASAAASAARLRLLQLAANASELLAVAEPKWADSSPLLRRAAAAAREGSEGSGGSSDPLATEAALLELRGQLEGWAARELVARGVLVAVGTAPPLARHA